MMPRSIFIIASLLLIPMFVKSQTDTLPAAVYQWDKGTMQKEKRLLAHGSTRDLQELNVYAVTLEKNKELAFSPQEKSLEKLIIVKSGTLELKTGDADTTIGPRSLALVIAGDTYRCKNTRAEPLVFYVLTYQSKAATDIPRGSNAGGSLIRDWNVLPVTIAAKGAYRPIFDRPSAMFRRFEIHATQLNPGFASHAPHTHRAEEIILLIKGKVQMQIGSGFYDAAAGDLVFLSSTVLHAAKNMADEPAEYYAIQWHGLP